MWYILCGFPAVMSLLDLVEEMTSTLSFLRLPGTGDLSPGLEMTENIDGSVYVRRIWHLDGLLPHQRGDLDAL